MLSYPSFLFNSDDGYNYSMNLKINTESLDTDVLFQEFFDSLPELKDGYVSSNERKVMLPSYINHKGEAILNGLHNSTQFYKKNSQNKQDLPFSLVSLSDDRIEMYLEPHLNPILNSHLSEDGDNFYFIKESKDSTDTLSLLYCESTYFSRACGFRCSGYCFEDNQFYFKSKRNADIDHLTRFDVHSITGIKTDQQPNFYNVSEFIKTLKTNRIFDSVNEGKS
jgi:hypothetical protein